MMLRVGWGRVTSVNFGNKASDNGGNNGSISDESFDHLISTVGAYLNKEKRK